MKDAKINLIGVELDMQAPTHIPKNGKIGLKLVYNVESRYETERVTYNIPLYFRVNDLPSVNICNDSYTINSPCSTLPVSGNKETIDFGMGRINIKQIDRSVQVIEQRAEKLTLADVEKLVGHKVEIVTGEEDNYRPLKSQRSTYNTVYSRNMKVTKVVKVKDPARRNYDGDLFAIYLMCKNQEIVDDTVKELIGKPFDAVIKDIDDGLECVFNNITVALEVYEDGHIRCFTMSATGEKADDSLIDVFAYNIAVVENDIKSIIQMAANSEFGHPFKNDLERLMEKRTEKT